MTNREALAATLKKPWPHHWEKNSIIAAAYERLAQLPEKCDECKGSSEYETRLGPYDGPSLKDCPVCNGKGFLYPPALVERIGTVTTDPRWAHIESPLLLEFAVAVLDALNTETP